MSTFPPDLYPQLVAAIFKVFSYLHPLASSCITSFPPLTRTTCHHLQVGMSMLGTETQTDRYGWPVDFRDLSKERYENRVHIARLSQTSKAFHAAVNARLDQDAHKALSFFLRQTISSSLRLASKPYADRAEMHRLWWPEDWPYVTNAQVATGVTRYKEPSRDMLKLFVVWIHRRRNQLAVQVGIHEHEGPIRVFRITDFDPNQDASDSEIEDDASDAEQTGPIPPQPTPPQQDQAEDTHDQDVHIDVDQLGTDLVVADAAAVVFQENQSEQDESEDDETLVPVTAITAIEDDIEEEEDDFHIDLALTNDGTDQQINLHYSSSRPRWIDPDRNYEDVTTAELKERVGTWITLQHMKFFPCLVQYEPEIFSIE